MQGKWLADLQKLISQEDSSLLHVVDDSVIAQLLSIGSSAGSFDDATDSLEAISNALSSISTDSPFLASVGGALNAAIASGAVTDVDTAMSYLKQLVTGQIVIDGYHDVQTADAATNVLMRDVVGNKSDAAAAGAVTTDESLVAYAKQIVNFTEAGGSTLNVPRFAGTIAYADTAAADDTADGLTPTTPKKTITAAQAVAGIGGAVNVKAGTYTENVVMDKNSMQLWAEMGTIIAPASGTPIVVSADYCVVRSRFGVLRLNPAANETGMLVSGNWVYVWDIRIPCNSSADLGFDITGNGSVLTDCRCSNPLVAAFKVQGDSLGLDKCLTGGIPANTSIGYWVTNSADKFRIRDCASQGHASGGFVIDTGCTNGEIINPVTGGGDGKWIDTDETAVWSNISYPEVATSEASLDANNETKSYNVARIYGIVKIKNVHIKVVAALSANITDFFLDIWDGTTSTPISKNTTLTISSAPVGSLLTRATSSSDILAFKSGATAFTSESSDYKNPQSQIIAGAKGDGTPTYLRMTYTTTDTPSSGTIRGFFRWEPINGDGFVEVL